jgi:putative autotransporter adhesin-like protein
MPTHRLRSSPALFVALALSTAACASSAPRPVARREVPAATGFTSLEVDDLDVEVRLGHGHQVSLRCDPAVEPYARVTVEGDVLRAEIKGEPPRVFDFGSRVCIVDVYMPSLRSVRVEGSGDVRVIGAAQGLQSVSLEGSGDVRFDDAAGEQARFALTGSGDLRLRRLEAREADFSVTGSGDVDVDEGTVANARLHCSGSGDINAARLVAESAEVRASGSGGVRMTARRRADVDVSGSGDVVIGGDPAECRARTSGSGAAKCQ